MLIQEGVPWINILLQEGVKIARIPPRTGDPPRPPTQGKAPALP